MIANEKTEVVKIKQYLGPIFLIVSPAIIIAVCIMYFGFIVYNGETNPFLLTSAIYDNYYLPILASYIIVLLSFFPFALKLFKDNGVSLIQKMTSKVMLAKDISFGIIAGIVSYVFVFLDVHVVLKIPVKSTGNTSTIILEIVSLVIISGILKEIYFRGIPYYLLKNRYGEWKAFLFGNICFTILDWPNFGLSFFLGVIWYLFFRKRGSLIIPIIGHGLFNLLGILARAGALRFIGIVPV